MQLTATTIAMIKNMKNGETVQSVQKHEKINGIYIEKWSSKKKSWLENINWRKLEFRTKSVSKQIKESLQQLRGRAFEKFK